MEWNGILSIGSRQAVSETITMPDGGVGWDGSIVDPKECHELRMQ